VVLVALVLRVPVVLAPLVALVLLRVFRVGVVVLVVALLVLVTVDLESVLVAVVLETLVLLVAVMLVAVVLVEVPLTVVWVTVTGLIDGVAISKDDAVKFMPRDSKAACIELVKLAESLTIPIVKSKTCLAAYSGAVISKSTFHTLDNLLAKDNIR